MITRRNFLKASAFTVGGGVIATGVVKSFIPELTAGESAENLTFDTIPVKNGNFTAYPPFSKWNSWRELDGDDWKRGGIDRTDVKVNEYMLVPTVCNNCEASCGLTAWVDKETLTVRKYMGNPLHTGSLGRNCAKGYAAQNQMYDPDRIPFPLKRAPGSKRGEGKWIRTTWDEALQTIGKKMRETLQVGDELSKKLCMYHVGRPNESGFTPRVWHSFGLDSHNSHTNICSAGGRQGSLQWVNDDRSAPDWANAKLILLQSSHAADAGHYFQQSAGQIAKARKNGAKLVVMDPRMSNSAGIADLWIACWPGTEAAIHLAMASRILNEDKIDRNYVKQWFNWQEFMDDKAYLEFLHKRNILKKMPTGGTFDDYVATLKDMYSDYTFEFASKESRVPLDRLEKLYEYMIAAGGKISSFYWRGPAIGNRGGWMSAGKTGIFMLGLLGSFGGPGQLGVEHGRMIAVAGKGHDATVGGKPEKITAWNELTWPPEWPLCSYEPSYLLPHLLTDKEWQKKWNDKGLSVPTKLAVWIPRQYNPVWINPDGFRWIEVIKDEKMMELTMNPTPTWSETNWYMDYILPVGLAGERHDQHSEPTNVEAWLSFRQPVLRVALEKSGWKPKNPSRATLEAHMKAGLGEVWEENEMWINLAFAIDPDGILGIRKYWESKQNPGKPITVAEYYNAAFGTLPNLVKAAAEAAQAKMANAKTPLEKELAAFAMKYPNYDLCRDRGTWTESRDNYNQHEHEIHVNHETGTVKVAAAQFFGGEVEYPASSVKTDSRTNQLYVQTPDGRHNIGVNVDGKWHTGFATPSKKMDFYVKWFAQWGWPEYAIPVYPRNDAEKKEMIHIVSQVHHQFMTEKNDKGELNAFALNPIFRLPYNIHTRSVNSKWLMEISQNHNPIWMSTHDAKRLGFNREDPVKVRIVDTVTGLESGYFIAMCVPTEGILPGTLACSHHSGRWKLVNDVTIPGFEMPLGIMGLGAPTASISENGDTRELKYNEGIHPREIESTKEFGEHGWPFANQNKDLKNVSWTGLSGSWQNAVAAPHPDPISAAHCWHHKVIVEQAGPEDKIGDVKVNIQNNFKVYQAWRDQLARPVHPDKLRRPEHLKRPWVPLSREAYKMNLKPGVDLSTPDGHKK
jgi:anaerobic selenocysteine-containing dehydrogenase